MGIESRLADWTVWTELFLSLSKRMLELYCERANKVFLPHHLHFVLQFNAMKSVRCRKCLQWGLIKNMSITIDLLLLLLLMMMVMMMMMLIYRRTGRINCVGTTILNWILFRTLCIYSTSLDHFFLDALLYPQIYFPSDCFKRGFAQKLLVLFLVPTTSSMVGFIDLNFVEPSGLLCANNDTCESGLLTVAHSYSTTLFQLQS